MTRKKLFILSLIGFLLIPVYWVASSTYERYQVAAKAEVLFNEIPTYPGATPVEKSQSFYTIGYGYRYKVTGNLEGIFDFYANNMSREWILENRPDSSSSKSMVLKRRDSDYKLTITVSKSDNQPLTSPPYDLTVRVHKP